MLTTTLDGGKYDTLIHEFLWEYRFGAKNQNEIGLPLRITDFGGSRGRESGAGDLEVDVKHNLSYNLDTGNILSVGAEVIIPTGNDELGFGGGSIVFEPCLSWGRRRPRAIPG